MLANGIREKNKNSKTIQTLAIQDTPSESLRLETIFEINIVESSSRKTKSTGNKNKGKGKSKQNASPKDKPTKIEPIDKKLKPHYHCRICNEDHYTKEFPH